MRLGAYDGLVPIGRGGMGVVFRGTAPDGRAVAVKLLRRPDDAGAAARFDRERRLLATMGDGFVPLLDAGESPDGPYVVMPFLAGGTLRARLERGPLPVREGAALVAALASALGRAHARGIVHRDLKPENVLFDEGGAPLVADLGLAKHFRRDEPNASASLSRPGEARGTAGYMAPEQIASSKDVGAPADVFALGVLLYECLVGRGPFDGDDAIEVLRRTCAGEFEPLDRARPGTPRALADVVARSLALDPAARFPDGEALSVAIDEAVAQRGSRIGLVAGAVVVVATVLTVIIIARPEPPPRDERPIAPKPAAPPVELAKRVGPPEWFDRIPQDRRPRLPLPPTVDFGDEPGVYVNRADGSPLVYLPPVATELTILEQDVDVWAQSTPFQGDKKSVERVDLDPLFVGVEEVTFERWSRFVAASRYEPTVKAGSALVLSSVSSDGVDQFQVGGDAGPSMPQGPGSSPPPGHPVVQVSWLDASAYCEWAHARLPTSREWIAAALWDPAVRKLRAFPWGSERPFSGAPRANLRDGSFQRMLGLPPRAISDGYARTSPVRAFPLDRSAIGAFDMAGNVYEWVRDESFDRGVVIDFHCFCGGSWRESAESVDVRRRWHYMTERGADTLGFRIVVSAKR